MGHFRPSHYRSIPLQWGNSPGADYFGGFSTRYAADGSALYGRELANGHIAYDLDAQVAVHALIHARLKEEAPWRTIASNSYADELAHRHDINCWNAADTRDRMLRADPTFAIPGQPGKFRTWDELTFREQTFNKTAIAAQNSYYKIRSQAEIDFTQGMLHWKPESAVGQAYRQMGVAGFQYLAGTYPEPHRTEMLGQLPSWRNIDPHAIATPIDMVQGIASHIKLKETEFEKMVTLPITDREQSFFHSSIDSLRQHGAAQWEPNPQYPADQPGAMEHGRIVLKYTDAQGQKVEKALDLDNNRQFTTTVHDAQGQLLEKETRTPTGPLVKDNFYTPSYAVQKTDANGQVISQSTLPTGPVYPSADMPLFNQSLGSLQEKYGELLQSERRVVIWKVDDDLNAQQMQSQQLYLTPDHPLHREPMRHPTAPKQQATQADWTPVSQPSGERQTNATQMQPQAALPPAITPNSSVDDMFHALYTAAVNKDDETARAVGRAYAQSPDGQAFFAEGKAFNEQQALQQQQEALAAQQAQEQQQQVPRGPVMRM